MPSLTHKCGVAGGLGDTAHCAWGAGRVTASVQQSADDIDPGCGHSGEQTAAGSRYTAAAVLILALTPDTGSSLVTKNW